MAIDLHTEIKIDPIGSDIWKANGIEVHMLRLDQIHPVVSGNKWFKLKHNLAEAIGQRCASVLTFGGAFSNHLIATAAAAKTCGLAAVGVVRGFHARNELTPTLRACADLGMQLHFVSRAEYKEKTTGSFPESIVRQYPETYIIPEGGDNEHGRKGTEEIAAFIPDSYTHVALPVGTGATFSGIRNAHPEEVHMLGFTAMKGGAYLETEIRPHLKATDLPFELITDYHFGGFAKYDPELIDFMNNFYQAYGIPLDMVYTAKMMYGIFDLIGNGRFPAGSKIMCIHTGGLQGNQSISGLLNYNSIS